ncbi:hypothetical protein PILCRDRAFT_827312 [Piloderma croceum F 1598]|uniref:Dilute domain-containing protein n=1 Tax=Piloderma croceum (strain F 1598) TaxID=765440 RepID=A0A0C3ES44_PILCF|nr:hypothetical protein PILCRDRAFT_827312 [Piloderma croceum F 1598]
MASSSLGPMDLSPEPDLHPLYPAPGYIAPLLSSRSGLSPPQKAELVSHCLTRSCVFGDLQVLSYLLGDSHAQPYVDLSVCDEDGLGLISITILGFGSESERDVEREECVRLLIAQGADVGGDNAGWTPLHHAALLSPPTLISHLMTHGCSPFAVTRRNLTALDIVTAHTVMPGREDVALLLEEAMRGDGWTGGRMEQKRKLLDERIKQRDKRKSVRDIVAKTLSVDQRWWGDDDSDSSSVDSDYEEEEDNPETVYTPPTDFSSMLVFSPSELTQIFDSLISNFQPSLRNSQPANTLYLLARFACLTCDHTWLEDLIIGATDTIEETFFNRPDDITCLVFWLYNLTMWLHLMQCDNSINEACEMLGSFELIEEVINSVYVFIIRFAERHIDQVLDAALLDYSALSSEFESVQFESDWSFLRPFSSKKKSGGNAALANSTPLRDGTPSSPTHQVRPPSPASKGFSSSLRQTFSRARTPSSTTALQAMFSDTPSPSPRDVTSFITALHTLLTLADINPVLITQLWSQVMFWTSCEIFNRILTRKKYLCRSKAVQINMNLSALEEWVGQMGLPRGVQSHLAPVRDLLNWLQCLSSIADFLNLVATIQTFKNINPLQMRRAVRDYKYEVNEGRMTEECVQYLTQLQKDWERHRIRLGVEAMRKEIGSRDTDGDESISSFPNEPPAAVGPAPSVSTVSSSDTTVAQHNIDMLFDRMQEKSAWEPAKAPQVLGELLDSRYMLPLLLPSDPRMLSASPGKPPSLDAKEKRRSAQLAAEGRSASRASAGTRGSMAWRSKSRKIREIGVEALQFVDGVRSASRWSMAVEAMDNDSEHDVHPNESVSDEGPGGYGRDTIVSRITPLTRKPSGRSKGRPSMGEDDERI